MTLLYLALPTDLRDRYKGSEWLAYARKIGDTPFHEGDTLVVSEWMFHERHALLQTLGHVRQSGARVVFIGSAAHESDGFKRDLCLMGVYDFLFVGDELVLQDLDALLTHPRSADDINVYLRQEEAGVIEHPRVVDIFEEETAPFTWAPIPQHEPGRLDAWLPPSADDGSQPRLGEGRDTLHPVRRVVWPSPAPVRVRLLGERGCGKSFVALQLMTLCHAHELPAAVVEDAPQTLNRWCDARLAEHVYASDPPPGYRVILDARQGSGIPLSGIDLIFVVTWPDAIQMREAQQTLTEQPGMSERVLLVVNHHTQGVLGSMNPELETVTILHEPRQFHAMRMKTPLVDLDPGFAQQFLPLVTRISACFVDPGRQAMDGGDEDALVARV